MKYILLEISLFVHYFEAYKTLVLVFRFYPVTRPLVRGLIDFREITGIRNL